MVKYLGRSTSKWLKVLEGLFWNVTLTIGNSTLPMSTLWDSTFWDIWPCAHQTSGFNLSAFDITSIDLKCNRCLGFSSKHQFTWNNSYTLKWVSRNLHGWPILEINFGMKEGEKRRYIQCFKVWHRSRHPYSQISDGRGVVSVPSVGAAISKGRIWDLDQLIVRPDIFPKFVKTSRVACKDSWGSERCNRVSSAYMLTFSCIEDIWKTLFMSY